MRSLPLLSLGLALAAGCGGDSATSPPDDPGVKVVSVTVSLAPGVSVLPAGFETPLTLRVLGPSAPVTWTVDRPDLAAVDSTGLVRALGGQGRVTVTATVGGVSGSVGVDVVSLPGRLAVEQWQGTVEDGLAIIPMDGSPRSLMPIEPNGSPFARPAWSPDGARLAYACRDSAKRAGVCVSRADGSNRIRVAASDAAYDFGPSWWPDGQTLLITDEYRPWRVAADNGLRRDPVALPAASVGDAVSGGRLAPDGVRVAYLSYYWAFPEDGQFCFGQLGQTAATCRGFGADPAWSPDGTTLVIYLPWVGLVTFGGSGVLTGVLVRDAGFLGSDGWVFETPTWSPDGQWVAFLAWRPSVSTTRSVYLVRVSDGGNLVRLSSGAYSYDHPSWGR